MRQIYFAYDGSVHGDWVLHYAVRLAATQSPSVLQLIYVLDGSLNEDLLNSKIERIRAECRRFEVELNVIQKPLTATVAGTILSAVPPGSDSYLVCATRVRERRRGLLSGTVSEQLLRSGHCHTLAVRVVQPGLLGLPRDFLLPVSGHPRGFRSGLPFLELFRSEVSHLHVLFVERIHHRQFRMLSHESAGILRTRGEGYCARIEQELQEQIQLEPGMVDSQVVISDDVPKEIVIAANKTKSRLIYLGASERNLRERFFFGNPIEQVLRSATCDVAIYRGFV